MSVANFLRVGLGRAPGDAQREALIPIRPSMKEFSERSMELFRETEREKVMLLGSASVLSWAGSVDKLLLLANR